MLKLLFCTSNKPAAVAIRVATWSDWSHVAIIDGDEVIEAVWPHVRTAKLSDVIGSHSKHVIREYPCKDPQAAIDAARSQIGKPYDWSVFLGAMSRKDYSDDTNWFCSELGAWALEQGGSPVFRRDYFHRVYPQHLWMIA
jgi:uncharacterized protein YycO